MSFLELFYCWFKKLIPLRHESLAHDSDRDSFCDVLINGQQWWRIKRERKYYNSGPHALTTKIHKFTTAKL